VGGVDRTRLEHDRVVEDGDTGEQRRRESVTALDATAGVRRGECLPRPDERFEVQFEVGRHLLSMPAAIGPPSVRR